jgi:hypothetical protein
MSEHEKAEGARCDAVSGDVNGRCRLPYGHDVHKGNGQAWIAAAGYDELAAAKAEGERIAYERGKADGAREERERIRRSILDDYYATVFCRADDGDRADHLLTAVHRLGEPAEKEG